MDKIEVFTLTDTMKERAFDESPRRHFQEKRQAMCDHLIDQLTKSGCLKEEVLPTGKPGEYTMTLTLRALK